MFKEKQFFASIWMSYFDAISQSELVNKKKTSKIKLGCNKSISHSSSQQYTDGTIQTIPVNGYFATPSLLLYNNANTGHLNHFRLKSKNNCFLGLNGYMNMSETRIVTGLKVESKSHIISSELLKPTIYLEKSITSPTSSTDYETTTNTFNENPGGYAGFNFVSAHYLKVFFIDQFKGHPHLFPEETFHHSERPFEIENLNIKLLPNHDIILLPNFDWFKAINATYILENGRQAMMVSKPYYQYDITVKYITV